MAKNQQVLKLLSSGKSFSEVAKKLGLTRSQVAGIRFRNRRPERSAEWARQRYWNDEQYREKRKAYSRAFRNKTTG